MTVDELDASTRTETAPSALGNAVEALWWVRRGDWDRAHERAQAQPDRDGAWVHAHLHRVEGDLSNAGYWYGRAGKPAASGSLDDEWREIAAVLLRR